MFLSNILNLLKRALRGLPCFRILNAYYTSGFLRQFSNSKPCLPSYQRQIIVSHAPIPYFYSAFEAVNLDKMFKRFHKALKDPLLPITHANYRLLSKVLPDQVHAKFLRILDLNLRNVNSWRTPNLTPLLKEPFKRNFGHVIRLPKNDVYDTAALVGFELKIFEFEPETSVQIRAFNGFFGSM